MAKRSISGKLLGSMAKVPLDTLEFLENPAARGVMGWGKAYYKFL